MKKTFLLLTTLVVFTACKSDDDFPPGTAEVDKLPPLTTLGANTVGCLVNGKAFLPKGNSPGSGGNPRCDYMDGSFMLGFFRNTNEESRDVYIYSNGIAITQGTKLILKESENNSPAAGFVDYNIKITANKIYSTSNLVTGELYINHLDEVNHTVSGTFWFNAVNQNNDTVKVREGRFDMKYNS